MRNLKRILSMTLAFALVLSIAGVNHFVKNASADSYDQAKVNQFTDINGHWAKNSLANLIGYGYMYGTTNTTASPNDTLTTAQLVALLVRIMGGATETDLSNYADMDKNAWYYTYFAQGMSMGIVPNTNSNYLNPQQGCSREYAAYMLCRAFGLTTREPIDSYSDADKVSDWAVSSMQAMVAAKAITGANGSNNTRNLNPQEIITRGEFAEMVYRLCKNFIKASDSASVRGGTIDGGLLISKSGTKLNGVTVKGNVYISDAVGTGDVSFEDTKVEGNIYVRGSGEHSVHLEGDTTATSVVFLNPYNATRLVVEDDAKISGVLINNGEDEVTLEGKVGNVTINVSDVDLTFEKAEATNVIVNSANSTVTVDKDSKVESLTVASSSDNVTVSNKGDLARLALMANNSKLDLEGKIDYLLVGAVSGLDLTLNKDIKLTGLDLHCSDSTIKLDSEIGTVNVSGFAEKLKLEVQKNAKISVIGISSASTDVAVSGDAVVGTVTLDAPKYKGGIASDLKVLTVGAGASEAELTVTKNANLGVLNVYANKVKVNVDSGSYIKDLNVTGTEVTVTGQGSVERVNIAETANKATVETPNTVVSNAGATGVKAGSVDLPANKSYTTTSTGKDVIRNNDGTPDGDGDKTTGAAQEVATVANYTLEYAANATAQDIDVSGKWMLDNLGNGLALTKNTAAGATYKLTGNVKKVDNFLPVFDPIAGYGTGYYVPVVLRAESMEKETAYTAETAGVRYTSANVSKGTAYTGKLIVYLQLQPGITNKTTTVTFDRDGAGTAFSPVTVSIDYSGVTFDGAQDLTGELFSYPTKATNRDLTSDGKLALADFGTMSLASAQGGTTYNVLGTANYIEGPVNGNTGSVATDSAGNAVVPHHYAPIMINTSGFQKGWTVALDGMTRYTASNVSSGEGCRGNLVLLLPMTPATGMTHTVYLDRDGDGRVDSDGAFTFNCVSVTLSDKAADPGSEFVKIPEYITVTLNTERGTVVLHDTKGDLYLEGEMTKRFDLAASYIESYLNSQKYTNISHELQGSDTVLFRGTKDDVSSVFSWSRSSGITFTGDPQEIPEGTELEIKDMAIVVHDTKNELKNVSDAVKESIVKKYIVLALKAANYTNIQQTVSDGTITTYATRNGKVEYFATRLKEDVTTEPMPVLSELTITYTLPGAEKPEQMKLPLDSTVDDLLVLLEDLDEIPGSYYRHLTKDDTIGHTYAYSNADKDKLADGDTIQIGYCSVAFPSSARRMVKFGDVAMKLSTEGLTLEGNNLYVLAGDEITVTLNVGYTDGKDVVERGDVTAAGIFTFTASGLQGLEGGGDVSNNRGIESIEIANGNSLVVTTATGKTITKQVIELEFPVNTDLSFALSAVEAEATTETYAINVTVDGTADDTLSQKDLEAGEHTVTYTVPQNKTATYSIDGAAAVAVPADGKIPVTITDKDVTVAIVTTAVEPPKPTYSIKVTVDGKEDATLSLTGKEAGNHTLTYTIPNGMAATYSIDGGSPITVNADGKIPVTIVDKDVTVAIVNSPKATYNINVTVNGSADTSLSKTDVTAGEYTIDYTVPAGKTATYSIDGGTATAVPTDGKIPVTVTSAHVSVAIVTADE